MLVDFGKNFFCLQMLLKQVYLRLPVFGPQSQQIVDLFLLRYRHRFFAIGPKNHYFSLRTLRCAVGLFASFHIFNECNNANHYCTHPEYSTDYAD